MLFPAAFGRLKDGLNFSLNSILPNYYQSIAEFNVIILKSAIKISLAG